MVDEKKHTPNPEPWLVTFANLGMEDLQPRPPRPPWGFETHARRLSYYKLDPQTPLGEPRSLSLGAPWAPVKIIQTAPGQIHRQWAVDPDDPEKLYPSPTTALPPLAFDHIARFITTHPSVHDTSARSGRFEWRTLPAGAPVELSLEELETCEAPLVRETIPATLTLVRDCFIRKLLELRTMPDLDTEAQQAMLDGFHWELEQIPGECGLGESDRIPLEFVVTGLSVFGPVDYSASQGCFYSPSWPGVVFAELLNVVRQPDFWDRLRQCPWCGAFFALTHTGPGRPREYCSINCSKTSSTYGPKDPHR